MGFEEEHSVGLGLGFEEEHDVGLDLGFELCLLLLFHFHFFLLAFHFLFNFTVDELDPMQNYFCFYLNSFSSKNNPSNQNSNKIPEKKSQQSSKLKANTWTSLATTTTQIAYPNHNPPLYQTQQPMPPRDTDLPHLHHPTHVDLNTTICQTPMSHADRPTLVKSSENWEGVLLRRGKKEWDKFSQNLPFWSCFSCIFMLFFVLGGERYKIWTKIPIYSRF